MGLNHLGNRPESSFWNGRRVLITGHTGFKGCWLTIWLLELGADVTGYALIPENNTLNNDSFFNSLGLIDRLSESHYVGDIRDISNLSETVKESQPEVVIHLAAQPLVQQSYADPLNTWSTNVQGSLHVLESLRQISHRCAVVMVTTDKVYENKEWDYGYREIDPLGGHDPYSASKAAAELVTSSWRNSFCGVMPHQTPHLAIATARAGNVIGGGDWAADRIIPDAIRALAAREPIHLRSPIATRPWQHVLDPLRGYLLLAERLFENTTDNAIHNSICSSFNFGPTLEANRRVRELIDNVLKHWPGSWIVDSNPQTPHEAGRLNLQIDKAYHQLGWYPRWDFAETVSRTVNWYRRHHEGEDPLKCCLSDLEAYQLGKSSHG